jgi:ABC-type Fe3+ transport system permease subunit
MRSTERLVAASQLLLIFPAVLFMGSLVVRNLSPLSNEPAHTAQQIVSWYAGRMWTLWIFLIALPLGVLIEGVVMLARNWSKDVGLSQARRQMLAVIYLNRATVMVAIMTFMSGAILTIVVLHMLAN